MCSNGRTSIFGCASLLLVEAKNLLSLFVLNITILQLDIINCHQLLSLYLYLALYLSRRSIARAYQWSVQASTKLISIQLRVTAARPGTVNFELDIQKDHTVLNSPQRVRSA